ncbi:MAG TPA: aldehyde dehydrogenase family protein [Steroidobacteraceae bacterium]|nr:aldehyde dehydrogenase family protein [Steroidobacteraceae bacterium]
MNASINSAASAIAAQPLPSAGVSKFFALKPRLFINGEWVEACSGKTVQVFDPATGRQIGLVADAGPETTYGLGASIWTNNLTAAHRLIPRIKAGTVWVNCHNLVDPNMPFGGYKQSGFGREHGRVAVEMYTEIKSVCIML